MRNGRILSILCTLVCLPACTSTPTTAVRSTPGADGTRIEYAVYGRAKATLVLVHGWSCDRSYWKHQMDAFDDDYTVIAVDLAGHGASGTTRQEWTIEAFGADVAAVVRAEKRSQVVLVGHSMGGAVVLEAARQLRSDVVHIVGVDTLHAPTASLTRAAAAQRWSAFDSDFSNQVMGFVRTRFFRPDADPVLVEQVATDMSQAPPAIALAAGIGLSTYDSSNGLKATAATPLTLLNATLQPTDKAGYQAIGRAVDVTLFEKAGHFPMLETPDEFNRALRAALGEH